VIKTFLDKQNLRGYIFFRHVLEEMLREFYKVEKMDANE
jgi:hypothetical protein